MKFKPNVASRWSPIQTKACFPLAEGRLMRFQTILWELHSSQWQWKQESCDFKGGTYRVSEKDSCVLIQFRKYVSI